MQKTERTILFMTNVELGQSSVMLAVASELTLNECLDIHIASFAGLENLVPPRATFHRLQGKSMKNVFTDKGLGFLPRHPASVKGAVQSYSELLPMLMAPWEPNDYLALYDQCLGLIERVQPHAVVLDPLLGPAIDACSVLRQRRIVLSPATFKDHVVNLQPRGEVLWKYPVFCSGFPVPLPLSYVFANIYLIYQLVKLAYFNPRVQGLIKARNDYGIPGKMTVAYNQCDPDILHLVPATRQTDWPFSVIPSNLIGCGPILPSYKPLSDVDPALASWLQMRPTVIINMGSHVTYEPGQAEEITSAIFQCLDRYPNTQFLWKCGKTAQSDSRVMDGIVDSRVRLISWLPSTPVACLTASSSVLAYVHHGGSNSFHEALAAGVPQVVCPVWIDTYEFATRAEMLGIGVKGNEVAAPNLKADELVRALDKVLEDSVDAIGMREKAKRLAGDVGYVDGGRKIAADRIKRHVYEDGQI
ncbi:glycosyltransferase family 1 protein [Astrocystis sublimbata]|nr:glycosyltransferase family 1 protein [Astrocystis sublimbata]